MEKKEFVTRDEVVLLYESLLNRLPNDFEVEYYLTKKATFSSVCDSIYNSDEFLNSKKEKREIVTSEELEDIYEKILGRSILESEKKIYFEGGVSVADALLTVWNSAELKQSNKRIRACRLADSDVIEVLYEKFLDRKATNSEIDMYILNNSTEEDVLKAICFSDEFEEKMKETRKKVLDEGLVQLLYRVLLEREISPKELWLYHEQDATAHDILEAILESEEYHSVKDEDEANLEEKNRLFDEFLGRPLHDYEVELFEDVKLSQLTRIIKNSEEYKKHQEKYIDEEIMVEKYGATTYKVVWDQPTTFTCVFNCSFGDGITNEVRKKRTNPWQEQYELLKYFPPQGTFVDLGANIGLLSCLFESKGWNGYAIEASHKNVECLQKAIELNGLNIEIGEFAVSDSTKKLRFLENGPWGTLENSISNNEDNIKDRTFSEIQYHEVRAYALDDWEKTGLSIPSEVTYIKMDIEGSEIYALNGMKKFLDHYGYPVIYAESNGEALFHFGFTTKDLKKAFKDIGYTGYSWENGKLHPLDETEFQVIYSTDYVFIKNMPIYLQDLVENSVSEDNKNEKIMDLLSSKLFGEQIHACSELRNHRQYLEDKRIKDMLIDLKKNSNEQAIQKALEWFELEEEGR